MTSNKYIVRQPIKNQSSQIIGYEIRYYGENQAYSSEGPTSSDFAAADEIGRASCRERVYSYV